jgi:DNA-binding CsgD family transcriptional regulator/pimeloyl-ACP methyl ester carboxylesterase
MPPPTIRYARTEDGVSIAYALRGEGLPIVCMPPVPFSHLEASSRDAGQQRWHARLAERAHVVQYDSRGTGMSEHDRVEFDLDALQRDLDAVVRAIGLTEFVLAGFFNASPAAIAYAVAHPEAVTDLLLWGGFARGIDVFPLPFAAAGPGVLDAHWQQLTDAAALSWTAAAGAEARSTAEYFRACVDPQTALRAFSAARDYDVTALLPQVQARTLVLHRRDASAQPLSLSRQLASHIPGADLVVLPGEAASPFSGDIDGAVATIERFLGLRDDFGTDEAPRDDPGAPRLTAREAEILALLARGSANKEIAAHLGLSVHTVERHLTNLYGKIGVRSRSEATAYALTHSPS